MLDAQALAISGIEQSTTIRPLDDMISNHPMVWRSPTAPHAVVVDPFAPPASAAADDQSELFVLRR